MSSDNAKMVLFQATMLLLWPVRATCYMVSRLGTSSFEREHSFHRERKEPKPKPIFTRSRDRKRLF